MAGEFSGESELKAKPTEDIDAKPVHRSLVAETLDPSNCVDLQVRYWPNLGDSGRALYLITPHKHALHRFPTNDCYIS